MVHHGLTDIFFKCLSAISWYIKKMHLTDSSKAPYISEYQAFEFYSWFSYGKMFNFCGELDHNEVHDFQWFNQLRTEWQRGPRGDLLCLLAKKHWPSTFPDGRWMYPGSAVSHTGLKAVLLPRPRLAVDSWTPWVSSPVPTQWVDRLP